MRVTYEHPLELKALRVKPCRCGNFTRVVLTDEKKGYYIMCDKCGKTTGEYTKLTEVREAWQRIAEL